MQNKNWSATIIRERKCNFKKVQQMKLKKIVKIDAGKPVSRVAQDIKGAPSYYFYTQENLENDLIGFSDDIDENKIIRSSKKIDLTQAGDVLFSLVSGTAAIVQKLHENFYYSQNFVLIKPKTKIDPKFLVYLLNENRDVRRSLNFDLQGSLVMKYTVRALKDATLPKLPDLEKQKAIGEIYFAQQRIRALKKRSADNESIVRMHELVEVMKNDSSNK